MKLTHILTPLLTTLPALAVAAPLVVAHRGSSFTAPENTLASVNLGWEHKSDAVEIDVHLSKDNRLIVIHDHTTSRTTGVPLKVQEADSSELRKLDAGSWKHARYEGEKLPFLEEVLPTIPEGKKLFIEIKSPRHTVPFVREAVEKAGKVKDSVIITFDIDTAGDAKKALPSVPVFWLDSTEKDKKTGERIPQTTDVIRKARSRNLDGVDLQYQGITKELVDAVHEAGMTIHAWTVDDPEAAVRLAEWGIDSITTNKPDVIREALEAAGADKSEKKASPAPAAAN